MAFKDLSCNLWSSSKKEKCKQPFFVYSRLDVNHFVYYWHIVVYKVSLVRFSWLFTPSSVQRVKVKGILQVSELMR